MVLLEQFMIMEHWEFHPLIANVDLTEEGVEYHCILTNAFGSVTSRTAILKLTSKLFYIVLIY